jgi:hypothetical protein
MLQQIERQKRRFTPYTNCRTAISITRKTISKNLANISINNTKQFVTNYFSQTKFHPMETIDEETPEELASVKNHIVMEFIDDYFSDDIDMNDSPDFRIDINDIDYDMVPEYRIDINNYNQYLETLMFE